MNLTIDVSPQNVLDLMITVIEGGSNYWCQQIKCHNQLSYQNVLAWTGEWSCKVQDDEDVWHTITNKSFDKVQGRAAERMMRIIQEEFDAEDADYVFQTLVYGEVIYG